MILPRGVLEGLWLSTTIRDTIDPSTPSTSLDYSKKPPIRLTSDNTINLTIFSDLHYGENERDFGPPNDRKTDQMFSKILGFKDTTFSIINGDLITGENTYIQNSSDYIDVIAKNLVDGNMRWASTYGNHDSKYNLSRERSFAKESAYDLSYTQHGPPGVPGVTNYYLLVYKHVKDEEEATKIADGETPLAILWFLDSMGGAPYQTQPANEDSIPNWVPGPTISWFRQQQLALKLQYGKVLPSLAFVHIPPQVFLDFQNTNFSSSHYPGLNDDVPLAQEGTFGDTNYTGQDVEFMQALVDSEGLHSVYSGHDHGDAWCGNWIDSVNVTAGVSRPFICFCKHSGYGGYGPWKRGVRVVNLDFGHEGRGKMEVDTWIRMDYGLIVSRVELNETYGEDVYPIDNNGE